MKISEIGGRVRAAPFVTAVSVAVGVLALGVAAGVIDDRTTATNAAPAVALVSTAAATSDRVSDPASYRDVETLAFDDEGNRMPPFYVAYDDNGNRMPAPN